MTIDSKYIVENSDGTTSILLERPVKCGVNEIEKVNFIHKDSVTVAHLEALDRAKGDVGASVMMVAELSDVSIGTVRKLRVPCGDMNRVLEFAGELLGNE